MNDPFNQLPTPPEFIRNLDAAATHAKGLLGCPVVLVACQDNGKMAISVEGIEEGSKLDEFVRVAGVAGLLRGMALMCALQDAHGAAGPQS